jgi:hypothetical protein
VDRGIDEASSAKAEDKTVKALLPALIPLATLLHPQLTRDMTAAT